MCSGSIIGECILCDESIWESQEVSFGKYLGKEKMFHKICTDKNGIKTIMIYDESVIDRIESLKSTIDICYNEIKKIEKLVVNNSKE